MANNQGAGQQDPSDSVGPFNPHAFAILQKMLQISTTKLVKVIAVDTSAFTVDVQIAVNQLDGNNNSTPHGTIFSIPYVWAMGGKNAFMVDPAVGDMGVMVICDRDISSVKANKAIANPGSSRTFKPSDGIYLFGVPGLNGTAPVQWIKWSDDGIDIKAAHGNELKSDATGWTFTGNVVVNQNLQLGGALQAAAGGTYAGNIHTTGSLTADAGVTGAGKVLQTHVHNGVTTGGGNTGPPT